jgi:lysophospholipase L1-like esterase
MFTQPSPLDHMWSLAIEEQFYLVWPLLVVGLLAFARRARVLGTSVVTVAAAGGALVSFLVLAAAYSPLDTSRAYYGTDARVGPTLLGAALAAVAARRGRATVPESAPPASGEPVARRSAWLAAGFAAVAVMAWSIVTTDGTRSWYYRGGLAAFSLAAIVVVHLVTTGRGGPLARGLSVRPLVALGLVSYGVYLWHWPVIVYLTPARVGVDGLWLDALCVAVTLALAAGSYLAVERPIRRGALRGRPIRLALAGSVAVTAAAVLVVTNGVARVPGTDVALAGSGDASTVYPEEIPPGASRILLVGDSGVVYLGPALAAEAERHGAVAAADPQPFCTVLVPEGTTRTADGKVSSREPCHDLRRDRWSDLVERLDPDVVVYYIAAGGGVGDLRLDGRWVAPCEATYDAYLLDALTADVDLLGDGGATVVLATTPAAPFVSADPDAVFRALECRRATLDGVVAARPATDIVDMAAFILSAQAEHEESFYRDPVHLSDLGAREVAAWLVAATLTPD